MNKMIDEALGLLVSLSPEELSKHRPISMAEAVAKKLLLSTQDEDNPSVALRAIQLVAERLDGRTVTQSKSGGADDFIASLANAMKEARSG